MVCYYGVSLQSTTSGFWGTLCHFDVPKLTLSDTEFELLQQAALLLPPRLLQV